MISHPVIKQTKIKIHDVVQIAKEQDCKVFDGTKDVGYHQYGNSWWLNPSCPYSFKYLSLESLYPYDYFNVPGHPDANMGADLYAYMQQVYKDVFDKKFRSVLELGTGSGEITKQFVDNYIEVTAVEGTDEGIQRLIAKGISPYYILQHNLKFMPYLNSRYDIVMCTEVAEHIEPFFASKIVDNCIHHSDVVWFSAADQNRQAHYHHVNEQPIEVWDNLFAQMGYSYHISLSGLHARASRMYFNDILADYLTSK